MDQLCAYLLNIKFKEDLSIEFSFTLADFAVQLRAWHIHVRLKVFTYLEVEPVKNVFLYHSSLQCSCQSIGSRIPWKKKSSSDALEIVFSPMICVSLASIEA